MNVMTDARRACLDALRERFGNRYSENATVREQHGGGESFHAPMAPDCVVYPTSSEEVSEIVKLCAAHRTPIVPYGTGTSLEGHVTAVQGGVTIDLSDMNEIVRVSAEDLDCTVQAGVTRKQLNEYIRNDGLMFPIDPGADASLGGMAATRASGTNAVRYGTMRENVLGVKTVLADGSIIETARRARKSAAGYDLTRLLVGSEGTLGIITEVTLRLHGIPEAISTASCSFGTIKGAVDSVILTIQSGLPVARIELIDDEQVKAINAYDAEDKFKFPEDRSMLWVEFHGTEAGVEEQVERFKEIAEDLGATDFRWATKQEERNRLWEARHSLWYANHQFSRGIGKKGWATDVCVPISQLADCLVETKEDVQQSGLWAPIAGHVGDGNFHLSIMIDPNNPKELEKAKALNDRLVERALRHDGTCTGEHGIGSGKIKSLAKELPSAVPVMAAIKRALDPHGIFNPGKVLDL